MLMIRRISSPLAFYKLYNILYAFLIMRRMCLVLRLSQFTRSIYASDGERKSSVVIILRRGILHYILLLSGSSL